MKNKVKVSGTVEYLKALNYLEEMLEKMKAGDLVLSSGEKSVAFHRQEAVELEIGAKEKEGKREFSFEMVWKKGLTPGEMSDFSISGETRLTSEGGESEEREFHLSGEGPVTGAKRFAGKGTAGECVGVSGSAEAPAACSEL